MFAGDFSYALDWLLPISLIYLKIYFVAADSRQPTADSRQLEARSR
jgi:hypothetical protein